MLVGSVIVAAVIGCNAIVGTKPIEYFDPLADSSGNELDADSDAKQDTGPQSGPEGPVDGGGGASGPNQSERDR